MLNILPTSLRGLYRGLIYLYGSKSYLQETGFMNCLKHNKAIDKKGIAVPWLNYALIHVLAPRLKKDLHMYEYGSGSSTHYFADKLASVDSIDHNQEWFDIVNPNIPSNTTLTLATQKEDYIHHIATTQKQYDIILVDGIHRNECVKIARTHLSDKGVLILDDTHRSDYDTSKAFMTDEGFRSLSFQSPKPLGTWLNETTLFYRDQNCLFI